MSTTGVPAGSIVVGVDGSPQADLAVDWAAHQAVLEHRPLTLVHAAHLDSTNSGLGGIPGPDLERVLDYLRVAGRELLEDGARRVARRHADVDVHRVLSTEDPRLALEQLARRASVVVIGSRGRGPVASLLLGSVSVSVAKHATCPVVVVRHDKAAAPGHGVLVGIDGTEDSLPAVEFAYRTASVRSLPLTAMHVFWDVAHPGAQTHEVPDDEPGLDDLRALLSESIAGMREKFPDVEDRLVLVRGFRDHQLVEASREMDLVVVGSRRRGFVDRFLCSSIAPTVVENAGCDVAVVPAAVEPA